MTDNFNAMNEARDNMDEADKQNVHVEFHQMLVTRFTAEIRKAIPGGTPEETSSLAEELAQAANEEAQKYAAQFIGKGKPS